MSAARVSRVLVVDRFEGEWAVVEVRGDDVAWPEPIDLPRWFLPATTREGDVLNLELRFDESATAARRDEVRAALDRLRTRDPGGDMA